MQKEYSLEQHHPPDPSGFAPLRLHRPQTPHPCHKIHSQPLEVTLEPEHFPAGAHSAGCALEKLLLGHAAGTASLLWDDLGWLLAPTGCEGWLECK